jgi:hypothetical protein
MKAAFCVCLLAIAGPALAQDAPPATKPEPKVQRTVVEDDAVRIEELRVRGQNQRIVVRIKKGPAGSYEVLPADNGRDPSQAANKGAAGQRVWHVLSF